jgi:hypothetical protein
MRHLNVLCVVLAASDYLLCDQYIGVTNVSGVYPVTIGGQQYQVRLAAVSGGVVTRATFNVTIWCG